MSFWQGVGIGSALGLLFSMVYYRAKVWKSHRAYLLGFAKEYKVEVRPYETNQSLTDRCAKALIGKFEADLRSACSEL
jgi:hypothetical protein